jgi:hypothetical protein
MKKGRVGGTFAIAVLGLLAAGSAWAQNCAQIQDAASRLACYDRQQGGSPAAGTAPLQGTPVITGPPPAAAPRPAPATAPSAYPPPPPAYPAAPPAVAGQCAGQRDSGRRLACYDRQPSPACSHLQSAGQRLTCYDQQQYAADSAPPSAEPAMPASPVVAPRGAMVPADPRVPHPGDMRPVAPADRAYDINARPAPADPRLMAGGVRDERRLPGYPPDPKLNLPLVVVRAGGFSDFNGRWELTVSILNQSQRVLDPHVVCQMTRQGVPIAEIHIRPVGLVPGHTATMQAIGPAVVDYYVDGAICRVIGPLV